jgi:hypothetical protein
LVGYTKEITVDFEVNIWLSDIKGAFPSSQFLIKKIRPFFTVKIIISIVTQKMDMECYQIGCMILVMIGINFFMMK